MTDLVISFHSFKKIRGQFNLTSILRFDGDDTLPLWTEALCGSSLNFELVGNVLSQVGDSVAGLSAVAAHLEGTCVTWRKQETVDRSTHFQNREKVKKVI